MAEDLEGLPNLETNIPLRLQYREIITQTQKHGFDDPDVLEQSFAMADELYSQVNAPTETMYDAKLIHMNSIIVKQKTDALHTSNFDTDEYVASVKSYLKKTDKHGFYTELAKVSAIAISTSPSFHFMYGAFEPGEVILKKKTRKQKNKDEQGKLQKPNVVASTSKDGEPSATEVEKVFSILTSLFHKQESSISYLEFVINPFSFAETVENMFHVAVLVKEGAARIFVDEDTHPFIEPIQGFQQRSTIAHTPSAQAIYSITPEQWKKLIKKYSITKPRIPTRRKT